MRLHIHGTEIGDNSPLGHTICVIDPDALEEYDSEVLDLWTDSSLPRSRRHAVSSRMVLGIVKPEDAMGQALEVPGAENETLGFKAGTSATPRR